VAVVVGQVGADEHHLSGQPLSGQELDRVGRQDPEGGGSGGGAGPIGDRHRRLGNGGAEKRRQGRRQAPDDLAVLPNSGEDPAHPAVGGVGLEPGETPVHALQISGEKDLLALGQPVVRVGPGHNHRHLQSLEDAQEGLVLGRLRRLVEEDVEGDGAHARVLQGDEEVGEEAPVQGRAIGQGGQGVLGDGHHHDVRILRFRRRQDGQANVGQPVFGGGEEVKAAPQGEAGQGAEGDDQRHVKDVPRPRHLGPRSVRRRPHRSSPAPARRPIVVGRRRVRAAFEERLVVPRRDFKDV
jgi:hypothetical protein